MIRSGIQPALSIFRRQRLSLADLEGIIDLVPGAALLLDLETERIVLANAKATELTAFTRVALTNLNLDDLFPDLGAIGLRKKLDSGSTEITTSLTNHHGSKVEIALTLNRLDAKGVWILLGLESEYQRQQQREEQERKIARDDHLIALLNSSQKPSLETALASALEASQSLTGAELLAVYLVDGQLPGLRLSQSIGVKGRLPDFLPPDEAQVLMEPTLWSPGKRANTTLKRAARAARLAYLASTPLGDSDTLAGLFVAAHPEGIPPGDLIATLSIIAAALTSIVRNHSLTSNLLETLEKQSTELTSNKIIQESIQDGVILLKPDLTIIELNPSAEIVLGYTTSEVSGKLVDHVLIGADNLIPALQSAQQGIPTHNLGNTRLHRRDGAAFLAFIQVMPVMIADQLKGIMVLLRDLTEHEQEQLRNQHLEQRAVLGEVTAVFAHEVRNPINNISTGLQLMAFNLPKDHPNQDTITRLEQDCARIDHLMDSILSFARPIENKMATVDLHNLLERLLERWRPRMARVKVQHHLLNSAKNPHVVGDPRALEQVFTNLVSNAVQAMSEHGGTLSINIRPNKSEEGRDLLEISVADNGPGIPEEDLKRVFEPFYTTNKTGGTGLGLAIAKRIISSHKGTIDVASVLGGTVFQVLLPVNAIPEE